MNHQYLVRGTFAFPPSEEYPDYESVAKPEMFWVDASDLRELARDDDEVMKLVGNRLVEAEEAVAPAPAPASSSTSRGGKRRAR